jgi:hypothetical protein
MVQPWVADQERNQQARWARYLSARRAGAEDGHPELGECGRCWPSRCPQCPWTPPVFEPDQGPGLAA